MKRVLAALTTFAALSSSIGIAQETPPPPGSDVPHAPSAAVDAASVELRLQALEDEMARLRPLVERHGTGISDLRDTIEENNRSIKQLVDMARENQNAIAGLRDRTLTNEEEIISLRRTADDNQNKLNQIVTGSASGGYMVDLVGKMTESPDFKRAVERATQGRLYVINHSDVERTLYLNGSLWRARPGRTYIFAPVGTVTAHNEFGRPLPVDSAGWHYNDLTGFWEMDYHF